METAVKPDKANLKKERHAMQLQFSELTYRPFGKEDLDSLPVL
jgi:hypothetical protein